MSTGRPVQLRHHLQRYGFAASGPLAIAAAQFLLALVLIARFEPEQFGRFSFLIVLSQFGLGLWSALFSAPLMVATASGMQGQADVRAIVGTSALVSVPIALIATVAAMASGASLATAGVYGLFVAVLLGRQVVRTRALGSGKAAFAALSDLAFALIVSGCALAFFVGVLETLADVFMAMLLAALAGHLPLWRVAQSSHTVAGSRPSKPRQHAGQGPDAGKAGLLLGVHDILAGYHSVWRRDSRWSMLGVVSIELTVNSHAYAITIFAGPAAFAPIAAAALFIRPVTVLINALNEFERARFAGAIHRGETRGLPHERMTFLAVLLAAWGCTLAAALGMLFWMPELLPHANYHGPALMTAVLLWFAIALARCLHTPDGALFQAQGAFRLLASLSFWTAGLSVLIVLAVLWVLGPVWSLLGILAGEGAYAAVLLRRGAKAIRKLADGAGKVRAC